MTTQYSAGTNPPTNGGLMRELIGVEDDEQLPVVAFRLGGEHSY
jgi:hypothetical protein